MLPQHKRYVGGSDLANLMGCGFGTKLEVYQRIVHGIDTADNDFMSLGRLIEPWARRLFERDFMVEVEVRGAHIIDDRWRVSTDGMIHAFGGKPRVWENKWTAEHNRRRWGPEGSSQVPEGYRLQANWYMGHEGADLAHLSVMFGAPPLCHYLVTFDPKLFAEELRVANAFWEEHIIPRKEPPFEPGDLERARDLDLEQERQARAEEIEADPALWAAALQLDEVRARRAAVEQEEATLKALVFSLTPENGVLLGPEGKRRVRRNRATTTTDWVKVAQTLKHLDPAAFDAAVTKYTTTKPGARVIDALKET